MKHVYEPFFGFHKKPFSLLPEPGFLFRGRSHAMALTMLEYGLGEQSGFVVLTGDSGTGKTLLLHHLAQSLGEGVTLAMVASVPPHAGDLLRWVLAAFGLEAEEGGPACQHRRLLDHLRQAHTQGRRAVLVVDEAQGLGEPALQQLRMLANVNAEGACLLQIALAGQPALRRALQRPGLASFVQRISVDCHLQPFDRAGTVTYIRHRLAVAGGDPELFDEEAARAAHYFARGVPRLINGLCDLALVLAYAEDRARVELATVVEAALARLQGGLSGLAPVPRAPARGEALGRVPAGA
jgi:type II secretory pathway predicted ATPase ExeA